MTPNWPFPKSALKAMVPVSLPAAQTAELLPYFKYAMERWSVPDDTRALAWVNATHDFKAALRCYQAIWLLDQRLKDANT
jgi:hypothetical protein